MEKTLDLIAKTLIAILCIGILSITTFAFIGCNINPNEPDDKYEQTDKNHEDEKDDNNQSGDSQTDTDKGDEGDNDDPQTEPEEPKKILILEQREGDSASLKEILDEKVYEIKIVNFNGNTTDLPTSVEDFRAFDQVILNNISPIDIDKHGGKGFIDNLKEYVEVYGGGLLTFGGRNDDGTLHAYNEDDFYGRAKSANTLQKLLPVSIETYRPPLGVVFIGDFSGSMDGFLGTVRGCINDCIYETITSKDYVGVMTLTDSYTMGSVSLMPGTNKSRITSAVNQLHDGGGTNFFPAVRAAITALNNNPQIVNKHIIIFTDGAFSEKDAEIAATSKSMKQKNPDITISIVLMQRVTEGKFAAIQNITNIWGGMTYAYEDNNDFYSTLNDHFNTCASYFISGQKDETIYPAIINKTSSLLEGLDPQNDYDVVSGELKCQLFGYYGSNAKAGADVIIEGPYQVPIYAQWDFGKGKVGSFMSDIYNHDAATLGDYVSGENYAKDLLKSEVGKKLLKNMIRSIMPTKTNE